MEEFYPDDVYNSTQQELREVVYFGGNTRKAVRTGIESDSCFSDYTPSDRSQDLEADIKRMKRLRLATI